jgi:hypothetical protein
MASETEPLVPPPARANPVLATAGYAVTYLAFAVAGGALITRIPLSLTLTVVVTLVVSVSTVLSLLFVLNACRLSLSAGVEAALLLPTTVLFLALRPEVTVALAQWFHLGRGAQARIAALPVLPGQELIGNLALILWAVLVGRLVSRVIREGKLLLPVAVAASLADIFTVFWGPVGKIAEQAPQVANALSAQAPAAEVAKQVAAPVLTYVGIGDFLFLAVFLSVALRYGMNAVGALWAAFVAMVAAAVVLAVWQPAGIPGLPFISVGVLLVNWRYLSFTAEEKRSLWIAGALLVVVIGIVAVLAVRSHG